jgi:hypothetical protein
LEEQFLMGSVVTAIAQMAIFLDLPSRETTTPDTNPGFQILDFMSAVEEETAELNAI